MFLTNSKQFNYLVGPRGFEPRTTGAPNICRNLHQRYI